MDRHEAAFEAFDGVELRLLNGRTVKCPALTVAEALRYLRLLGGAESEPANHDEVLRSFPERIGIMDERLVDLGLEVEGLAFGDMTTRDAFALVDILARAMAQDYAAKETALAQVRILDEFPETFGLPADIGAAELFGYARGFAEALYLRIYGLAQDFCGHLTASPPVTVMTIMRATAGATS